MTIKLNNITYLMENDNFASENNKLMKFMAKLSDVASKNQYYIIY